MIINPGDIFFTHGTGVLPDLINSVEKIKSKDNEAVYSHCGVCTGGITAFESLTTIRYSSILDYVGNPFMLARHKAMDENRYLKGMRHIVDMNGAIYPFHRLFLIALGLGDISVRNWLVCSELVAKFLYYAGFREEDYCGVTPDNLSDEMHLWDSGWEILFEGVLTRDNLKEDL